MIPAYKNGTIWKHSSDSLLQTWFPVNNNGDFLLHDRRNSSFKKIEEGLMNTTELPIVNDKGKRNEPETEGDTLEPETGGDTIEPETERDTVEPDTEGDTLETEIGGDTLEPETGRAETGDTVGAETGDTVGTETGDTIEETEVDTVGTETRDTEGDTIGVGAEKKEREIFTSGRADHSSTSGTVIDSSGSRLL